MRIYKYNDKYRSLWDDLVTSSKNGTFLFYRDYMDYHSDRFDDCSFIVEKNGKCIAALPGNIYNNTFYSHQGLTYGGLISSKKITIKDVIIIFDLVNDILRKYKVNNVVYKPVPYIYHIMPAQEDVYALYLLGAEKIGCNISSALYQDDKIKFSELRRRGIKKSIKYNVKIYESTEYDDFWDVLNNNLKERYDTKAVHSLNEIKLLSGIHSESIRLFKAYYDDEIVAGVVVYQTARVAHVQYIASNDKGKEVYALDGIFDKLINQCFKSVSYFDFGISTEEMGKYLNEKLIFQKEGFGARGVVYDVYQYQIT